MFVAAYQAAADLTCSRLTRDVDALARTEHAFSILVHKIQPERPLRLKFVIMNHGGFLKDVSI